MLRVGITGASGQIGSHLVEALGQTEGIEVVAVCRNSLSAGLLEASGCEVRVGSITDGESVRAVLGDCDAVVHCALASGSARQARQANEAMVRNLARLDRLGRLIHFSSVAVYGSCIDGGAVTFDRPRPDTYYGREKLLIERATARAFRAADISYFILRLGHVYGARQWLSRGIVAMATEGRPCLPYDGRLLSNAIRSDNLAAAIRSLLLRADRTSRTYNVANLPQATWRQVCNWHTQALDLPRVLPIPEVESDRLMRAAIAQRHRPLTATLLLESLRWLRSLPRQYVSACPSLREIGLCALAGLPASIERRARAAYASLAAAREIAKISADVADAPPWLLCDAMPGPFLAIPERGPSVEDAARAGLVDWYEAIAGPGKRFGRW